MDMEPDFRWPDGFRPDQVALYVRNVRRIEQSAEAVWETLVAARSWPAWYPNASATKLPGDAEELALGMRFRWTQTGIRLDTEVREFDPPARIAWFARSPWIQAYHAWDIQPDGDACIVVTDETQRGILPRLFGRILKPKMLEIHDVWLDCLQLRSGWTDDMRVALPPGKTVDDVVDRILGSDPTRDPDELEAALSEEFDLSEENAALARDRAMGGVVRAATGNVENRPDRVKDPIAWTSFERAWSDRTIVARHFPKYAQGPDA
jgi:uncharacterized protein YndB with AHSA1/START domain